MFNEAIFSLSLSRAQYPFRPNLSLFRCSKRPTAELCASFYTPLFSFVLLIIYTSSSSFSLFLYFSFYHSFKATSTQGERNSPPILSTNIPIFALRRRPKSNERKQYLVFKRPSARRGPGIVSVDRNVRSKCRCSCVLQFTS